MAPGQFSSPWFNKLHQQIFFLNLFKSDSVNHFNTSEIVHHIWPWVLLAPAVDAGEGASVRAIFFCVDGVVSGAPLPASLQDTGLAVPPQHETAVTVRPQLLLLLQAGKGQAVVHGSFDSNLNLEFANNVYILILHDDLFPVKLAGVSCDIIVVDSQKGQDYLYLVRGELLVVEPILECQSDSVPGAGRAALQAGRGRRGGRGGGPVGPVGGGLGGLDHGRVEGDRSRRLPQIISLWGAFGVDLLGDSAQIDISQDLGGKSGKSINSNKEPQSIPLNPGNTYETKNLKPDHSVDLIPRPLKVLLI